MNKKYYFSYNCFCNRGVSAARKAGIKASKGKHLIFVDGDDWIFGDVFKISKLK